ncbi:MAG: protein-glutamate O-methyltransferase CheR, partial [Armatimonadetes bacterium]|nr:protein-glutamate O-methyltransferase CheR [Armatimonadota bacterium]
MLSSEILAQAKALIADRVGLDFGESRLADFRRGLLRAFRASSLPTPEAYLSWLAARPPADPEWRRVAGHLTVGETYFFRDRPCFNVLERHVLSSIIAARRAEGVPRLRLWSAGCATGDEPYSLAILLDRLIPDRSEWTITVLATDINVEALEAARRGIYREWSLRDTPEWARRRYFRSVGGRGFQLDAEIMRMVTFAPLNLAADGYPSVVTDTGAMDVTLCRNVMMYFNRRTQRETAARLCRALAAGGWLVVSPAEASAELFHPLVPVNFPGAILFHKTPGLDFPLSPPPHQTMGPDAARSLEPARLPEPDPAHEMLRVGEPPAERSVPARDNPPTLGQARELADRGDLQEARRLCLAAVTADRLDTEAYLL